MLTDALIDAAAWCSFEFEIVVVEADVDQKFDAVEIDYVFVDGG